MNCSSSVHFGSLSEETEPLASLTILVQGFAASVFLKIERCTCTSSFARKSFSTDSRERSKAKECLLYRSLALNLDLSDTLPQYFKHM